MIFKDKSLTSRPKDSFSKVKNFKMIFYAANNFIVITGGAKVKYDASLSFF